MKCRWCTHETPDPTWLDDNTVVREHRKAWIAHVRDNHKDMLPYVLEALGRCNVTTLIE